MANRINFTKTTLEAIPPAPKGKRDYYNDTKQSGLQLQVTDKGTKTFYLYRKIQGKPTRNRIDTFPNASVDIARKEAQKLQGLIAQGVNPQVEKRKKEAQTASLEDIFTVFKLDRDHLKPKTLYDYGRHLKVAFPDWLKKPMGNITKDKISDRHSKLTKHHGAAYANNAMRTLSILFNFAHARYEDNSGQSIFPENPVKRLSKTKQWNPVKRRKSCLKKNQLPAWFKAVDQIRNTETTSGPLVADYLTLSIFTGLRRNEAAGLTWANVDFTEKTLTIADTKNNEPHTLPLTEHIYDLLKQRKEGTKSDFVFPGKGRNGYLAEPRKQIEKVKELSEIQFTLHDLRRTFITIAESLDIPAYALKNLLNHKTSGDVTAGYIIIDVDRLRGPMQKIEDFLLPYIDEAKKLIDSET